MHIQNKNTLCACGSGDKYKHCCGHKALVQQSEKIDQELNDFHSKLIQAASQQFNSALLSYIKKQHHEIDHPDRLSIFQAGLYFWFVACYLMPNRKQTIFEALLNMNASTYHKNTVRYLRHWQSLKPSIFYVNRVTEEVVELEELTQGVPITLDKSFADDLIEDTIVIGTLSPFTTSRRFLIVTVKLFNNSREEVLTYLEKYPFKKDMAQYPSFLKAVLNAEYLTIEWEQTEYEAVADMFIDYMVEENKDDHLIMTGMKLWHDLCREKEPQVKNIKNYAAALTYMICSESNERLTQAEIAKLYEVNPSTLSQTLKRLK